MLKLCFPLKAGRCASVARCLWLGEAERCGCSLVACLHLPLGTRVDTGSMVLVVRLGSVGAVLDQPLVYCLYGIPSCHVLWQTHGQGPGQSLLLLAVLPEAFSISLSLKQHLWLKAVLQNSLCSAAAASYKFCAWFCFSGMYQVHPIPFESCSWVLEPRTAHEIMILLEIMLLPLALCCFILSCIMQHDAGNLVIITKGFKIPF